MNYLFSILIRKKPFLKYYSTEAPYWYKDLSNAENALLLTDLEHTVSMMFKSDNKTEKVIVEGHWHQKIFDSEHFGSNITVEYIQLIRECRARRRSWFLYFLRDSRAARAAKRQGEAAFVKHQRAFLNLHDDVSSSPSSSSSSSTSVMTVEECLKDYNCLHHSGHFGYMPELEYFCGLQCQAEHNHNLMLGSLSNLHNPASFIAVGVTDKLMKFLEMLECSHQRTFGGIKQTYLNTNRKKVNEGSLPANSTASALNRIINDSCIAPAGSSKYSEFYEHVVEVFTARYNYMIANPTLCCRNLIP